MPPLEKLYRLEMEFHRRLRMLPPGISDAGSLHLSYALQTGYEPLFYAIGRVTGPDIECLHARLAVTADPRDIQAAHNSLKQILGFSQPRG